MLNIKNILNQIEIKAVATLPIGEKQREYIVSKFKKDMIKALNTLWLNGGTAISREVVSNSLLVNDVIFGVGEKLSVIMDNWKEDMLKPLFGDIANTSGKQMSTVISNVIGSVTNFDITDPAIVDYINKEAFSLVVQMKDSQIESLRETLRIGIKDNIRPARLRQMMRENLALTKREVDSTWNVASKEFERAYKEGIEKGLNHKRASERAFRSSEKARLRAYKKAQNVRAARIHRTETTRLNGKANQNSINQAIKTGKVESASKTWVRTGYNDNWESSIINDGQTVGINETFRSGNEYPDEINERCYLDYKIKYKKGA